MTNVDIVTQYLTVLGEMDPDHVMEHSEVDREALDALTHPDFQIANPIFHPACNIVPGIGDENGILHGKSAILEDIDIMTARWEIQIKEKHVYDLDDFVLFVGKQQLRGRKSGKEALASFTELFWVNDSLVKRIEPFINTAAFKETL